MERLEFVFFSGILGFTSVHIGEVRKEISRRVEKEKVVSAKHDIELQLVEKREGIPIVLYSCYLYNDSFEMIHGSIPNAKQYLKESWVYHVNRMRQHNNS